MLSSLSCASKLVSSSSQQRSRFTLPSRRCKSYEFSFPNGVTVSHDSRVYVCAMSDTLEILEADGSMSEMPLCPKHKEKSGVEFQREDSPFEQIECVQASSWGEPERAPTSELNGRFFIYISAVRTSFRKCRLTLLTRNIAHADPCGRNIQNNAVL